MRSAGLAAALRGLGFEDAGVELDRGEGNVRLFHNRFTNVFTAVSIQPVYGGPTYVLRNQVEPPFDPSLYPSPLSSFRRFHGQAPVEGALMTVSGLPQADDHALVVEAVRSFLS